MQDAHSVTAQGRQRGVRAASLVLAAAPILLVLPPS